MIAFRLTGFILSVATGFFVVIIQRPVVLALVLVVGWIWITTS